MSSTEAILVSIRDAARMLSVSSRTIQNLLAAKRLPARKIGRRTLIPHSALEQLARHDTPTKPEPKGNEDAGQSPRIQPQS